MDFFEKFYHISHLGGLVAISIKGLSFEEIHLYRVSHNCIPDNINLVTNVDLKDEAHDENDKLDPLRQGVIISVQMYRA